MPSLSEAKLSIFLVGIEKIMNFALVLVMNFSVLLHVGEQRKLDMKKERNKAFLKCYNTYSKVRNCTFTYKNQN